MEKTLEETYRTERSFTIKDPGSAITHFIGLVFAMICVAPLLKRSLAMGDSIYVISDMIFIGSMILLYGASTAYHTFNLSDKKNKLLKRIDHLMIFILIAGSYTPICLVGLHNRTGYILCAIVWAFALTGMIVKAFWINCPKWFSSVIYIGMGWLCVLAFPQIYHSLPTGGFVWLLAGGIIYTIGGIIYALKVPLFNSKHKNFGSHEIFHLFVMGGSLCHFICIYAFITPMALA